LPPISDSDPSHAFLGSFAGITRIVKTKLKIIIITFLATTAFWCLVIVGVFSLGSSQNSGVGVVQDAQQRGFVGMMSILNPDSQPVTFTVEELRTNVTRADTSQVILLERQVPPSGGFWVGIRKAKTEKR